ncbi:MAG: hypothetical protein Q4G50_11595 [Corynebacterium sp.]|uniref:hypothetical protein n=1 Tax=Corynebacterium sp. TaxID=1720 RepID=UPI0026DF10F3|nr:hypothetical protein [Corynebacterium sp.]MDO5670627.1 hypothetical protein [Corynebacterium sp.]
MITWRGRRILLLPGLLAALGTVLLIGIPSDIIPNPLFGREVPVRWWEYPVLGATALLTGAWFSIGQPVEPVVTDKPERSWVMSVSVFAVWFAVACPVCNKLILLVLGTSGAMGLWAPAQPYLAVISLVALTASVGWKWKTKLDGCADGSCAASPAAATPPTALSTPR